MNIGDRIARDIEAAIAQWGWTVRGVYAAADGSTPEFSYSVGLHDKGIPELIMFGFPMPIAAGIINAVAVSMLTAKEEGKQWGTLHTEPGWPITVALLEVPASVVTEYATHADQRSQGKASYIQIVWPDEEGRFPWNPDVSQDYRDAQLMLGHLLN